MTELILCRPENGKVPTREFMNSLDKVKKAKMLTRFEQLEQQGYKLDMPAAAPVRDGFKELRCKVGNERIRILYFFCEGKAVLLNGFQKKEEKTPKEEVDRAAKLRDDFLQRKDGIYYEHGMF